VRLEDNDDVIGDGRSITAILPSVVFRENSTVYGWQIQASKPGKIYIQVYTVCLDLLYTRFSLL